VPWLQATARNIGSSGLLVASGKIRAKFALSDLTNKGDVLTPSLRRYRSPLTGERPTTGSDEGDAQQHFQGNLGDGTPKTVVFGSPIAAESEPGRINAWVYNRRPFRAT
jgi:hypothetical protein